MRRYHELTSASGREVDLPYGSIVTIDEMFEDTNPNFPEARSFVRYKIGEDYGSVILKDTVDELITEADLMVKPNWLRLTHLGTKRRTLFHASLVTMRQGIEDGCRLVLQIGPDIREIDVNETRRQIKKWSEPPAPTLPDAPAPTPA